MSFLQISCARPGHRRAGVAHPAFKVWPADAFSAEQLDLLRSDPTLNVVDVATAEATIPVVAGSADLDQDARRRLVTDIIRLLAPDASEPLIVDMSTAVLAALQDGTSPHALRIVLDGLFAAYATAERNPEGAPPADADAPGSTATTSIPGAAGSEASGAVPASPETEAGEGGKGAEADAAEAAPPASAEAAKPRRKAR